MRLCRPFPQNTKKQFEYLRRAPFQDVVSWRDKKHNILEMGATNVWRAGGGGELGDWKDKSSVNGEGGERLLSKLSPTPS